MPFAPEVVVPPPMPKAEPVAFWEVPTPSDPPPTVTVEQPLAAWPEPEVVPPPFDPAVAVPLPATPVESVAPQASEPDGPALPRRDPGSSPLGRDAGRDPLPQRSPGNHLSHRPEATPRPGEHDVRPRPERVHDLLTRHLRGIRDGREEQTVGVTTDRVDAEDLS